MSKIENTLAYCEAIEQYVTHFAGQPLLAELDESSYDFTTLQDYFIERKDQYNFYMLQTKDKCTIGAILR